jgi:hypothetical protein
MKIKGLIINFLISSLPIGSGIFSQTSSWGNTFIPGGSEAVISGQFQFTAPGTQYMAGVIATERTLPVGTLAFSQGATWINASDVAHVDGYVKSSQTGFFVFPIGDNGFLRPAAVSRASEIAPAIAAYFNVNPSTARTTDIKDGGYEPVLPAGGPFDVSLHESTLSKVSSVEYWDVNGTVASNISLTWNSASTIQSLTAEKLSNLTIVGWDGSKWVKIPSAVDVTSIMGSTSTFTSGSITTTSPIIPNTYSVYTLAGIKERVLASVKIMLSGAWTGSAMSTSLNALGLIPLKQPYNVAPFNYSGDETVTSFPTDITDWVLVQLLDANNVSNVLGTRSALLKNNGLVVDVDGASPVEFKTLTSGSYYVRVLHRNHLSVRSAVTIALTNDPVGTSTYDFTTSQAKAYQNADILTNAAMVNIDYRGIFGLWGGDGNVNGRVSYIGVDNDEYYLSATGLTAFAKTEIQNIYSTADYNMNGTISYGGTDSDELFLITKPLNGSKENFVLQHN